mmetsp:Transcript_17167/g.42657  ORF Transcript_17167/g.42657 Transcript_17167/m.42657 type:complete len:292 (-) Transcript_17167:24-899(-)
MAMRTWRARGTSSPAPRPRAVRRLCRARGGGTRPARFPWLAAACAHHVAPTLATDAGWAGRDHGRLQRRRTGPHRGIPLKVSLRAEGLLRHLLQDLARVLGRQPSRPREQCQVELAHGGHVASVGRALAQRVPQRARVPWALQHALEHVRVVRVAADRLHHDIIGHVVEAHACLLTRAQLDQPGDQVLHRHNISCDLRAEAWHRSGDCGATLVQVPLDQRATAIWTAQVAVLLVGLALVVDLDEVRQAGAADALVAEATGTRLGHLVHADETLHRESRCDGHRESRCAGHP